MKVAIIGCGVTGMSAGIILQKAGIETVIFEKEDKPGGVIAVYGKKDIVINNALEFVYGTAVNTFANDMWQSIGMFKQSPVHENCFKTFLWNGNSVGIYKDFDKTVNELLLISPQDKKRILRLKKAVTRLGKIELPLITENSSDVIKRLIRLFLSCFLAVPDVLRFGLISFKQYGKKIKGDALREFFSDILNCDRSVLQYLVLWSFFAAGNFSIPDNNQQEMISTLYDNYISSGGRAVFNSNLIDAVIEDERITALNFSRKSETGFDYVIFSSDISAVNTIMNNSGKSFPVLERAIKKEHVTSSVMLYFSLDYEAARIIPRNASITCKTFKTGCRYQDNFSVRIQNGAEAEKQVVSVTLYQNEKDFREWKSLYDKKDDSYKLEKDRIALCVKEAIEDYFPSLKGKLQLCDMITPVTYYRYTGAGHGGWMPESWNPSVYLHFGRGKMPGIKNASIAGQKVFPIGGTTVGAFSGVTLAERIIKLNNRNKTGN